MNKTLPLIALVLILTACLSPSGGQPAPQVTVTSTPPPTDTPAPTMTPTPVAVDGIAENAEGNKLAYLNGEWTMLPALEGEYAKLLQQPGGKLVAVDADGRSCL
jgi:hypothetical protein